MKLIQLILLIVYLTFGCTEKKATTTQDNSDTIKVEFTVFHFQRIDDTINFLLVLDTLADTIRYSYHNENPEIGKLFEYKLIYDSDSLRLVDNKDLAFINTFHSNIDTANYEFLKYETVNPIADSEGATIFCKKYGWVADASYAWNMRGILTKWNDKNINQKLINRLLEDSLGIFTYSSVTDSLQSLTD